MPAKKRKKLSHRIKKSRPTISKRTVLIATFAVIFGLIMLLVLRNIFAATFAAGSEAENGVLVTAVPVSDPAASGGSAVKFGPATPSVTLAAPTKVRTFVGGTDIAVTWIPTTVNNVAIGNYNVYRNGVKVTTTKSESDNGSGYYGTQYIDKSVSGGQTYSYQIEAVDGQSISPKTAAVTATQPTNSAPVPTVTLDASIDTYAADKKAWINQYAVPALKTWYPKISQQLAYPDYTPPGTIRLATMEQSAFNQAYGSSESIWTDNSGTGMIVLNPGLINKKNGGYSTTIGAIIYAATTQVIDVPTLKMPRWLYNGITSYAEYNIYNGATWTDPMAITPQPDAYYTDGFVTSATFLNWLQSKYDSNYIRKVTIAAHKQQFNSSFVSFSDGRNYDEAWALWQNLPNVTGPMKNVLANKCIDNANSVFDSGNKIQLWSCNGTSAQKYTLQSLTPTSEYNLFIVQGYCLQASGSAENSPVRLAQCNKSTTSQHWKIRDNNFLTNANSDRCLVPYLGAKTDGTEIVIANCNNTTSQAWTSAI